METATRKRTVHAVHGVSLSRRERRKRVTRSELIRAGRKLFSRRGLYDVRIEDLAQQADIAKGTVYLYFSGKPELIEAVAAEGLAVLEQHIRSATVDVTAPTQWVERVAAAHFTFFGEYPDLMRIFHQTRGMMTFRRTEWHRLREPFLRYVTFLSAELARRRSPGSRISNRDRSVAIAIFGCVSGVASTQVGLGHDPPRDVTQAICRALAQMACGRRDAPVAGRESSPRRSLDLRRV